jgi:putative addiction module component (TIGR02574 family)
MSATEVVEQFRKLPFEEQHEAFEKIREVVDDFEDELTPGQIAELDRRAEDALKNPGRGTPVEEVSAEIQKRLLAKK